LLLVHGADYRNKGAAPEQIVPLAVAANAAPGFSEHGRSYNGVIQMSK
jgi:hypothetical protein